MKYNFHLVAAPAVLALLGGAYYYNEKIASKRNTQPAEAQAVKTLTISRATWGENCNPHIENSQTTYDTPLKTIEINNVLDVVSKLCNGKETCEFPVRTKVLGNSPLPKDYPCMKELAVEFRCDILDIPTRVVAKDKDLLRASCEPPVENPKDKKKSKKKEADKKASSPPTPEQKTQ